MAKLKIETKAATPRQFAMIAVLGIALFGAIYWSAEDQASSDAGAAPAVSPAAARLAAQRAKAPLKTKKWPPASLDAALAHDPFSSPLLTAPSAAVAASAPDAAMVEEQSADLLALKASGVSMIVRDGAGMVATVGERKLRIGDVIDGYRIVAIEMDGVVLQRISTE